MCVPACVQSARRQFRARALCNPSRARDLVLARKPGAAGRRHAEKESKLKRRRNTDRLDEFHSIPPESLLQLHSQDAQICTHFIVLLLIMITQWPLPIAHGLNRLDDRRVADWSEMGEEIIRETCVVDGSSAFCCVRTLDPHAQQRERAWRPHPRIRSIGARLRMC